MELYTAVWANKEATEARDRRIIDENELILRGIREAVKQGLFYIIIEPVFLEGRNEVLEWLDDRGFHLYYKDAYTWKDLRATEFPITNAKEYKISWRSA